MNMFVYWMFIYLFLHHISPFWKRPFHSLLWNTILSLSRLNYDPLIIIDSMYLGKNWPRNPNILIVYSLYKNRQDFLDNRHTVYTFLIKLVCLFFWLITGYIWWNVIQHFTIKRIQVTLHSFSTIGHTWIKICSNCCHTVCFADMARVWQSSPEAVRWQVGCLLLGSRISRLTLHPKQVWFGYPRLDEDIPLII